MTPVLLTDISFTVFSSAYLNGFYYWWACGFVLSFSMGHEAFHEIPLLRLDKEEYFNVKFLGQIERIKNSIALIIDYKLSYVWHMGDEWGWC